ncbi:MAG: HEAT repeat domain-containing protein [Scytonema sp. PMC 1069.18]|nr:HEAT repeat domain-containing protein [Scytonema sp. PMC 1069.18]MEC4881269.1 HEAT repeat domain-containing protein [Scytonema sp. PMC 1070.18]
MNTFKCQDTERWVVQLDQASSPDDIISAIQAISISTPSEAAIVALIQALNCHYPSARTVAVEALVKLAPATVEPLICAYRNSTDQGLQAHIIQALAQIGDPRATNLLAEVVGTEVANHCQGNVRRIAARGLGQISSTHTSNRGIVQCAVEKLTWALLTPEDWGLRYAAAVSLQEIATPEAYSVLQVAHNQESDKVVRSRIAFALEMGCEV